MQVCEHCEGLDRPEALIVRAQAEGRRLADQIIEAEDLIEPRLRGVARTIARMAREQRLHDRSVEGPLSSFLAALDAAVAGATRTVLRTTERGWDEHGPTYDTEQVQEIDPAAAPLVRLLDRTRAIATLIERARDIVAAEEAVSMLREQARRR